MSRYVRTGIGERARRADERSKHRSKRPCGNPPAKPTNVVLTFTATEARTHLRFTGKVKWDEVTTDEQGHAARPDRYDVQLRATDTSGNPVESEDGKPRIRTGRKAPVKSVALRSATNPSGTTYEFVTRRPHGFLAGDNVKVRGCKKPTTYNGTYAVATVVNSTTFRVTGSSSGVANCDDPGEVLEDDDRLHLITRELPRPKTWCWQTRVRAVDEHGCGGDWSAWTPAAPLTPPYTGADPQPPAPTGLVLSFDRKDKSRTNPWRAVVSWTEVTDFDYPGTPADDEDDVARYAIQFAKSDDGGSSTDNTRRRLIEAKDADADTTAFVVFHKVHKRFAYRARVRCIDRFNRRGPWSSWTTWQSPSSTPPTPTNVRVYDGATNRIPIRWDAPTELADSDVIDEDIDYFQVQISQSSSFSTIYDFDRFQRAMRKAFKVEDADEGSTFYARVRSVNADNEKSAWIPATLAGNSNPGATPSGVTIGAGGGGGFIKAVFTKPGRLRARHYPYRWTNITGGRLNFVRARAVVGARNEPPGSHAAGTDGHPIGSNVKINLRRWLADESAHEPVFQTGMGADDDDRLIIAAGTHKDVNAVEAFDITFLDPDEQLSVKVASVGSSFPGEDLVVSVFMEPA